MKNENLMLSLSSWIREAIGPNRSIIIPVNNKIDAIAAAMCLFSIDSGSVSVVSARTEEDSACDSCAIAQSIAKYLDVGYFSLPVFSELSVLRILINLNCKLRQSEETNFNMISRFRTVNVFSVADSLNATVVSGTSIEDEYIGNFLISTKCCLFPFINLYVSDIRSIGESLGLPEEFLPSVDDKIYTEKIFSDRFNFTYKDVGAVIRAVENPASDKIIRCHDLFLKRNIKSKEFINSPF